jgi:AraC-like DNA-binding protein
MLDEKDASVAVGNIVEEILFNIYLTPFDDMSREHSTTHPLISAAIEYINAHYKEPITVSDISEHLFVTKSHLHHLFTQTMQISPKRYINLKRISKARQLILLGEKPYEVYICCGFKD